MASFEMQWRGGDSASEFGPDDSVFPFFNSSPNRLDGRPRLLASDQHPSGSISGPQPFPISEYPTLVGIPSLGDYAFLTNGGFAEPAAIPRPRSMVDDVDSNLNYYNSYPDRSATLDNDSGSGSGSGYSYGLVPTPLLLAASGAHSLPLNRSFMQPPQSSCLDSQFPSPIHTVVTSRLEPLDMVPTIPPTPDTRQVFFSPDGGIYDMASSAHDVYHLQQGLAQAQEPLASDPGGIKPSFSFSLPGMPNAEEAFLSQFQEPAANIGSAGAGEALTGGQQQDVHYPSTSDNHPTFDALPGTDIFGTNRQDLAHRGGSPSTSDSSKSSQKRGRDQVEPSTPVKRQRVNRSEDNYVQRSTRKKKENASFDLDLVLGSDNEDENDSGNDDSDAYIPSRTPSPVLPSLSVASPSPSSSPPIDDELSTTVVKGKRGRARGKGKAKGSAARALAIVTRAREEQEAMELRYPDLSDGDGLLIGGASTEGTSRTRRAPLPVPVPNLIKKSRGRKVPYVPVLRGGEGVGEGVPVNGIVTLAPSGRRGRRRTGASDLDDEAPAVEARTFVCMVPGCGKCFVRGEHLKRHVRSIHTDDKRKSSVGSLSWLLSDLSRSTRLPAQRLRKVVQQKG